jgi:hypothetical protein
MSYDHGAQQELNKTALGLPEPGDYWHEMFCPYFLVVASNPAKNQYTILSCISEPNAKVNCKDGWSFDFSKHQIVNHEWIEKQVTYGSIPGYVADVRRSDKFKSIVREWKQFHAERLLKELKELGPEVSQMILQAEW